MSLVCIFKNLSELVRLTLVKIKNGYFWRRGFKVSIPGSRNGIATGFIQVFQLCIHFGDAFEACLGIEVFLGFYIFFLSLFKGIYQDKFCLIWVLRR